MIDTIPSETMQALIRYHWPGNIRELQNVIERAVIISKGPVLNVALSRTHSGCEFEFRFGRYHCQLSLA